MKVASLYNPHAVLAAYGYKTIETRQIDTEHRGWLAIHATKEWPEAARGMMNVWPTNDCLVRINNERVNRGFEPWFRPDIGWPPTKVPAPEFGEEIAASLPRGAIIGVVWLAKTERTDGLPERWNRDELLWKFDEPDYNDVPAWEPSFGDYTKGRRAWWLCHPTPLRTPLPVNGWPGMWDTRTAAERDGLKVPEFRVDPLEEAIVGDIEAQGLSLPDMFDPAFYRLINRRGTVPADRPKEKV